MKNIIGKLDYEKYYKELLPYAQEERNKRYLFLILTFGTSIFFLLFAISPTISTIANLKKQISDNKFVEQKLSQKISNLSALSQSYNQISPDLPSVINAIPKKPEAPTLTAQIQSVADNSNVTLTNIQISSLDFDNQTATISAAVNFSASAIGKYEDLQNFLDNIIDVQRLILVNYINITGGNPDSSQMQIRGTAFYKP